LSQIEKKTAPAARTNGNQNPAMVVGKALEAVLRKAKLHGTGIAGPLEAAACAGVGDSSKNRWHSCKCRECPRLTARSI